MEEEYDVFFKYKLTKYVLIPIIKKLKKKDIKWNINEYIEDQFNDTFVYEKNTTINDIDNDITTKWIIINSLGEQTQSIIEGNEKSAYEIWKLLKESFTKSKEQRKIELTKKIENLKFDNKDISIFIANLQNLFNEIAKIDSEISDSSKIGILNRCLPENLRWINVFQFSTWNDCSKYVKRVIPEINLSNIKKSIISSN